MSGSVFVTVSENIFGPMWKSGMYECTRKEAIANQKEETLWYFVNDQSKTFNYFISMHTSTKPQDSVMYVYFPNSATWQN